MCFIVKPPFIPRNFFSISCGDAPRRLLDDVRARVEGLEACGSLNGYNDVSRSEADVRHRARALLERQALLERWAEYTGDTVPGSRSEKAA